ncbi:MAG: sulfite exporter TauE/SafE family protein [Ktedonobacteraceae bacterium]|nr:sulfite exporter TauE/SafE family protein [Ktedonobacteraceae bacterium]MBO0796147.1 sulfite exporter TauE/SafE family protein [Ktedonobacteraceae bacterium]
MTFPNILLLFIAAVLGGTLNAVAGGGSFFCFPALVFTGMPPITANATNTVALWPGSLASVGAYRREMKQIRPILLILLTATSLIGGILGALLLLNTSPKTFERLIPFLLLLATLLFAFSGPITARLRLRDIGKVQLTRRNLVGISVAQLVISVYGGYFGGGIGILMLATLALMGMEDIHAMNALKTLLATFINGIAVVTFIIAGIVSWPQAIVMVIGAIAGGYGGAYYARKINPKWIRLFVIVVGLVLTVYFFIQYFVSK